MGGQPRVWVRRGCRAFVAPPRIQPRQGILSLGGSRQNCPPCLRQQSARDDTRTSPSTRGKKKIVAIKTNNSREGAPLVQSMTANHLRQWLSGFSPCVPLCVSGRQ